MKRLTLIVFSIFSSLILQAQESVILLNYNALKKKIDKSNVEITDPKASINAKTWLKRGELMQDAFRIDLQQVYDETTGLLYNGMTGLQIKLFYKEPLKESEQVLNNNTFQVLEYERMHYYFLNDGLSMWKRIKTIFDNPLDEAFNSYSKVIELDKEQKLLPKIKKDLTDLKMQFRHLGINDYYSGYKEKGLESFEKVGKINNLSLFEGVKDTLMIQYSGIVARELGDYNKSIDYYKQLKQLRKDPSIYISIKEDYLQLKDTTNALSILEEGFSVFPDTVSIVANLVDLCIKTNLVDKGMTIISKAIDKNPSNGLFYYWKGRLTLKSSGENRIDQALAEYNKAIEINPNLSYAYFDIGFIYFLIGQDFYSRAGAEKDAKIRDLLNKEGNDNYNKAMPMLEKAVDMNKDDKNIKKESFDTLKRIYYKLQLIDKYNDVNEKLKNL
jgi:tetratricopeptide (TPR) repeat protein